VTSTPAASVIVIAVLVDGQIASATSKDTSIEEADVFTSNVMFFQHQPRLVATFQTGTPP